MSINFKQMNKFLINLISLFLISNSIFAQNEWKTNYETSNFKQTMSYDQVISFSKKLANASEMINYQVIGQSPRGVDIPLLIVDKEGITSANEAKKKNRLILLIQAAIHPGEPEGIDAGLLLIRDIIINNKNQNLLDGITLLFIPSFNVDGHKRFGKYNRINQNGPEKMGWRTNSMNLNLNRDYLKADAPEIRAWLQLFNDWLPDFFIDCHTTDGADYQYSLTYMLELFGNMPEPITNWQKQVYLPYIEENLKKEGHLIFPYVAFRKWHDPKSGLRAWISNPAFSQGYTAAQNRAGLLVETHMLKKYKIRVDATYQLIKHTLEILKKEKSKLLEMNQQMDEFVISDKFRNKEYILDFKSDGDSIMVEFKGNDYKVVKSDLTGGLWYQYTKKPKTYQLPYYNSFEIAAKTKIPVAYIIAPEWIEVIERIKAHGIKTETLKTAKTIEVESYKFNNVKFANRPFEGRQQLSDFSVKKIVETKTYPKGSIIIFTNQRNAKVIAHILEPEAPNSYLRWGFFNTIFEQKEYAETYVMEKMAREMINKDPELKKEFEKKQKNGDFFNNQWMMTNWFYSKTLYWDTNINTYPVGRITDIKEL